MQINENDNILTISTEVNNCFWDTALSCLNKNELIELCNKLKINIYATKNGKIKSRERLSQLLSQKIELNKRMNIEVSFYCA